MEKILRENKDGKVQLTIADERWYLDTRSEKPRWVPSCTWIASYYPKGKAFYQWLASKGWDEAEEIKLNSGEKGTRVHSACDILMDGEEVAMNSVLPDRDGVAKELTIDEYTAILSFKKFCDDYKPVFIAHDLIVFNDEEGYAGTLDLVCKIEDEYWIIDLKTSKSIYPSHIIQVASYHHAYKGVELLEQHKGKEIKVVKPVTKLGILQLGYTRNKNGFKLTEVEDKYDLFLAAKKIWADENEGVKPKVIEFPETIKLETKVEE